MRYEAFEGQDSRDLISMMKKTLIKNLQSLRVNQYSNDQESSNNVDVEQDERQKKFSKRQLNTKIDKVIKNFLFISLVKCTLQSLEGQKREMRRKEKEYMEG